MLSSLTFGHGVVEHGRIGGVRQLAREIPSTKLVNPLSAMGAAYARAATRITQPDANLRCFMLDWRYDFQPAMRCFQANSGTRIALNLVPRHHLRPSVKERNNYNNALACLFYPDSSASAVATL